RHDGIVMEGLMTFCLMLVISAIGRAVHGIPRPAAAFAGGLTVTAASCLGGPFTGGAMNPARALAPAAVAHHCSNHAVYWIGPLAGGVIGAWISELIFLGTRKE